MHQVPFCLLVIWVLCVHTVSNTTFQNGNLFLTPLINDGKTEEALEESKVELFTEKYNVSEAHSGFITVDSENSKHFFFLYVGAQEDDANQAPLVLWLQGGPGESALFGQFLESGPVGIQSDSSLYPRKLTLQKDANVIYLDQPVGSGYSFSNGSGPLNYNLTQMTEDIDRFMRQFLLLLPKFNGRDFYVVGESFGARVAVLMANRHYNLGPGSFNLTLRGVVCSAGFVAPLLYQLNVTDVLYKHHLLNDSGRRTVAERYNDITTLEYAGERAKAVGLLLNTTFASWNYSDQNLFRELTNHTYEGNVLQQHEPPEFEKYREFVSSQPFKDHFHIGQDSRFYNNNTDIFKKVYAEYLIDISTVIEQVLENYRVLVIAGSLDALIVANATKDFFGALRWKITSYEASIQTDDFEVYAQKGSLALNIVRNAGHYAGFDRPDVIYGLITRFIDKSYWEEIMEQ